MKKILILFIVFILESSVFAKSINVEENDNIYHVTLSGTAIKKRIKFILSKDLKTNKEIHKATKSKLTINTGFFDPKNGKTISYVYTNYMLAEDPMTNDGIMFNPLLRMNLKKILNRTEFRVLDCNGKLEYQITQHNTPVDFLCSIKTSAQGGPQLLPELKLEEEFFIVKNNEGNIIRQSASVLNRTARTVIALKDGKIHILIITDKNPKNIFEVRDLCKSLGFEYAMAFDGGSSTSFNYKNINITSTEEKDTGRRLKSFMIIE